MFRAGVVNQHEVFGADRKVVLEEGSGHLKEIAVRDLTLLGKCLDKFGVVDPKTLHKTSGFGEIASVLENHVIFRSGTGEHSVSLVALPAVLVIQSRIRAS